MIKLARSTSRPRDYTQLTVHWGGSHVEWRLPLPTINSAKCIDAGAGDPSDT